MSDETEDFASLFEASLKTKRLQTGQTIDGSSLTEMPRNSERSFCCGAGGARMWMEEKIGKRINLERTDEALDTGAEQIVTGCPFCKVMLTDGLTARQGQTDQTRDIGDVEVVDVAQMLLAGVKGA